MEEEIKKYRQREKRPRLVKRKKNNYSEVEHLAKRPMHQRDRLKSKVKKINENSKAKIEK